MDQSEFNRMMQTVQEIEVQIGYPLLTLSKACDPKTGKLVEASWSHNGRTVFRQTHPFTEQAGYVVHKDEYNRITNADFTK